MCPFVHKVAVDHKPDFDHRVAAVLVVRHRRLQCSNAHEGYTPWQRLRPEWQAVKARYSQSCLDRWRKYHSEWTGYDEDFFGTKKSKESQEFSKMMQDSSLPNYYATLEIAADATSEEIKTKFRQLAKENHPDRSKDDNTVKRFAEITKAYEVLSNEESRKDYDKYYKASFGG